MKTPSELIVCLIAILITFASCNSVKKTYESDLQSHFESISSPQPVLTSERMSHLPDPVKKYLEVCGYIGKEIPMNAEIVWSESQIKMKPGANWMKLQTLQFNSVKSPFRIAYMKAKLAGFIPFEGRDIYTNGSGHMYGKLGKIITIFDEKQREIAQSALIIILAEALLVPGYALQDYIQWEEIDEFTASATIHHGGITASGTFHFNEQHELVLFQTNDRYFMSPGQGNVLMPFSAEIGDYFHQGEFKVPGSLMAVWHLESGRYEYWKGNISEVKYNVVINPGTKDI